MTQPPDGTAVPGAPAASAALRRRRLLAVVAAVALLATAAIAVRVTRPDDTALPVALPTQSAEPRQSATATATPARSTPTSSVDAGAPVHLRVDAVGLDAEVLPTASVAGAFDPPTLGEAYWIEAFGAPGKASDNTVYLLGHSWDDGAAVFNPLFDRAEQTSKVAPGDLVVVSTDVGEVTYRVDRTERIPKREIAQDSNEVWEVVPGRLLLITCFQNDEGGATLDNFVVFADIVA